MKPSQTESPTRRHREQFGDPLTDASHIDLAEDGGRAITIEEAMSALVFAYASEHNYLEGKAHVDNALLETIRSVTAQLEVSTRRAADWKKAILTGYRAWRRLRETDGGFLDFDMTAQTLEALASGAGGGTVEDDLP